MMDQLVLELAEKLNEAGVLWGIGASYMLKSYGIVEVVHDFDIVVAEKDIAKALEALDSIAVRQAIPTKTEYKTKHFHVYDYKGLDMDVMSGFKIEHSAGVYDFTLDKSSIVKREDREGVLLPFTSLEDWLVAYKLMINRGAKVQMIEDYLRKHSLSHPDKLHKALKQPLPKEVQTYLIEILQIKGDNDGPL